MALEPPDEVDRDRDRHLRRRSAARGRRQLDRPLPRLDRAAAGARRSLGEARPLLPAINRPDGPGPFPTALLFSGCDGPKDNLERWAAMLRSIGWASIIVDSHGPRGFSDYEIWRLVCAGQLFMGSERAGDVLVAIDDARRMRFVDPDRIVLVGSSHGGWAIMDLLALDPPRRLPTNLAGSRAGAPADPLAGVVGAILLYPYCGQANRARRARLDPADPDAVRARRGRRDRRPRASASRIAERLSAAALPVEVAALRRRDPRLRPAGPLGAQPARLRRGGDRRGDDGRPGVPDHQGHPVTARRNTARRSAFPLHRRKDER